MHSIQLSSFVVLNRWQREGVEKKDRDVGSSGGSSPRTNTA